MHAVTFIGGSWDGCAHEYDETELKQNIELQSKAEPIIEADRRGIKGLISLDRYQLEIRDGMRFYVAAA